MISPEKLPADQQQAFAYEMMNLNRKAELDLRRITYAS